MTDLTDTTELDANSTDVAPEAAAAEEQDTFPRSYVQELREESKEHRTARQAAEEARDAMTEKYRLAVLNGVLSDVLRDPSTLPWNESFETAEGGADVQAITEAADALIAANPSLAMPRGDVLAGFRESEAPVNLADLMRR